MSIGSYRSPLTQSDTSLQAGIAHPLFPMQSVRTQSSTSFISMPGMEGSSCVDMYGDLPFGLFLLPNATLRGDEAYIFTSDGTPVIEQNADFLRKRRFLRPRLTEDHRSLRTLRTVDEVLSLSSRCDAGFFHWMMDSLPKVVIAEACGFNGSYLIPSPLTAPWAEASLELLGIPRDRIIHHTDLDIHAARLFIPTYFSGYNAHHNTSFMNLYREAVRRSLPGAGPTSRSRILIARKSATKVRRILNQDEVQQVAQQFGFQSLYFEDLSLREQLQRVLSADAIIGAHGSGLCHALFMDNGSTVVELFPFSRKQSCDCYETLSTIPEHRYLSLESAEDCEGDIIVPCAALHRILTDSLTN